MSKSRIERILTCADRNEVVTPSTLRRWFRVTQDYKREFDGTVVRSARKAVEDGLLKRVYNRSTNTYNAGEFQITAKGYQVLENAGIL